MYVSLNGTLTAGGKLNWPEFAKLAAKTGYLGVDLNLSAAMQAGIEETRALLAELRLKPAIVGLPVDFRKDDASFRPGLEKLPDAARFAAQIGCPRMGTWIMPSTSTPKPELRKIYQDRFQAISAVLGKEGVRLALENVTPLHLRTREPHEFIWRYDEMLEFAKECGPNVGLLLDSWHWHHGAGTAKHILAAGNDRVVHVQVADAPKLAPADIRDNERLFPGEGVVDFGAFFGALKKIGYAGGVSPEIFGRGIKAMPPEESARLGLKQTQDVMRKAGVL
jgi:sugar phosphate isomerase/epimerase